MDLYELSKFSCYDDEYTMPSLKKLIFPPVFLLAFTLLIYQVSSLFESFDIIFSFSLGSITALLIISLLLTFSSFLYALFTSLGNDWRINLGVGIAVVLLPFLFLETSLAIIFGVLLSISLTLSYFNLQSALASYLNFTPNSIFGPSIRHLTTLLVISISIIYFLSINKIISEEGFQIPDFLIESVLKLTPLPEGADLLQQTLKQTVKEQFQNFLKPYQNLIPAFLTILLFLTLQTLSSIINLLIYPLLWITFHLLENTGIIKFTTEMRAVKKMELS